jgi:hypothetical protein
MFNSLKMQLKALSAHYQTSTGDRQQAKYNLQPTTIELSAMSYQLSAMNYQL